jgi:uncharacterized protein YmfQ (DUF2313 family)
VALGFADEFARLDGRADDLIEEADPRTTDEMLPDWEGFAGLPDPAIPRPIGLPARRAALQDRLIEIVGQNASDYIDLIARYGYPGATISFDSAFVVGVSGAGDPVGDGGVQFWWIVTITAPIGTVTPIVAVEHAVRRRAPLHTFVTFEYVLV